MRTLPEHEEADETHITSQLVHTKPERMDEVCRAIDAMEGCEVFERTDGGKIIVIAEGPSLSFVSQTLDAISALPGVVNTVLVYHHLEPSSAMDEEMPELTNGENPCAGHDAGAGPTENHRASLSTIRRPE